MSRDFLRWASIRSLIEGKMQKGSVDVHDALGRDEAIRPQDYGFAAQPVSGQGLVMEVGGHTIILRQDRLAERPSLAEYEVCVWHKEGHHVTLKAGGIVQIDCDQFNVNAATSVTLNTPLINAPTASFISKFVKGLTDVLIGTKSMSTHRHKDVQHGTDNSGEMV